METTRTKYAVTSATNRTVIFVCDAASKKDALQQAMSALDRTKVPASWSAWTVAELPADLQADAAKWQPNCEEI